MTLARPRLRRLIFGALAFVLVAIGAEVLGLCTCLIQRREWFSYSRLHAAQHDLASPPDDTLKRQAVDWSRPLVVHPFFGYAVDPQSEALHDVPAGLKNDPNGFQTGSSPIQKRAPDKVIVAITGGSVAYWLSVIARRELIEELSKAAALKGKRVELVTLAIGGFKQPQQLMALTWFLALGGEFDVVINLDGFNELALSTAENLDGGTFPFYPRSWPVLAGQIDDRPTLSTVARLSLARDQRAELAQAIDGSWLRWSIAANALWSLRDAIRVKEIARLEREIADETRARPRTFLRNGPPPAPYADTDAYYRDLAQFWKRASIQISFLAQANGFRYFHFLQANQYDLGSKTLTAEERERFYHRRAPYRVPAEKGYPFLREAGVELAASGVAFHDLSRLFADRSETVYIDDCCHYQELGYQLMAKRIGRVVAERLDRK
ncbi:MAG TPA: hypothetical protein VFF06_04365 [Polyangia bacterium]|nr:hypothetical protein [Polyangia bacterium]